MNKWITILRETTLGRFLVPLGIILIVFSTFMFKAVDHARDFIRTDAVVTKAELYEEAYTDADNTRHEATYTIFVKYTVDGKEYEGEYGIFPEMKEGEKVKIAYNPADPTEIVQPTGSIWPIGMLAGGIVALAVGALSIVKALKKYKALEEQEKGWSNGD